LADAPVRLERDGDVAVMVLEDPPLNLFREETQHALEACVTEVESSDARAFVWRAEGKLFTGGVDVNLFQRMVDEGGRREDGLLPLVQRLEALEIPTMSLLHGVCFTWGLEIALGTDLIWASESARIGLVEANVGLTPGAGGTQRMAQRAGAARAAEFVFTAGFYEARLMYEWGVVNRVVPDADLHADGLEFARRLAAGPTRAHAATKAILRAFRAGGVPAADAATPDEMGALFHTEDLQNAVRTFLADGPGKATFEGR
jgi:enoyl-CoA hydratase/carnithine racemase